MSARMRSRRPASGGFGSPCGALGGVCQVEHYQDAGGLAQVAPPGSDRGDDTRIWRPEQAGWLVRNDAWLICKRRLGSAEIIPEALVGEPALLGIELQPP